MLSLLGGCQYKGHKGCSCFVCQLYTTREFDMAKIVRRAAALWRGNLVNGKGALKFATGASGGFNLASRVERPDGKTSPEELMAAAHASCYSMALSNILSVRGYTSEHLIVDASCVLEYVEKRFKITTMLLNVRGKVPNMDSKR